MVKAAEAYIKDAVGEYDEQNPKMRILLFAIVQDFYENRVLTVTEAAKQRLSHTIGTIVAQLQAEELVKKDG